MKKFFLRTIALIGVVYLGACAYMYFYQEDFIFHPRKLEASSPLLFTGDVDELFLTTSDNDTLNAIHVKVPSPKGLVFYLHGNTGNLNDQVQACQFYNSLGYDFFSFDYRTFGKSTGELEDEEQFFKDVEFMYDYVNKSYIESDIHVVGYSVGTASAAMIASKKSPKQLMLIAPYYSVYEIAIDRYKVIPGFLLKYPFETNKYLTEVNCPVLLVHGDQDAVLPFDGSNRLSKLLKENDIWLPLEGQDHNNFELNPTFKSEVIKFFN